MALELGRAMKSKGLESALRAILPALPPSRQAIVQSALKMGSVELRTDLPMPPVPPDHVLIKRTAVAGTTATARCPLESIVPAP
ncbi:hypothetical protein FQN53_000908 [Emmonsiellopsis sp. PD_33]|nr:hypothetical protein FQN53_000908 [Emmonsiellopsis sp. PD_33]